MSWVEKVTGINYLAKILREFTTFSFTVQDFFINKVTIFISLLQSSILEEKGNFCSLIEFP